VKIIDFALARLSEPSSYAGFAALLAAGGVHVDNPTWQAAFQLFMAGAGFAAVLMSEKSVAIEAACASCLIETSTLVIVRKRGVGGLNAKSGDRLCSAGRNLDRRRVQQHPVDGLPVSSAGKLR
jgi:hypothetical protein